MRAQSNGLMSEGRVPPCGGPAVLVAPSFIAFHANAPLLPFDLLWLQKPWRA